MVIDQASGATEALFLAVTDLLANKARRERLISNMGKIMPLDTTARYVHLIKRLIQ